MHPPGQARPYAHAYSVLTHGCTCVCAMMVAMATVAQRTGDPVPFAYNRKEPKVRAQSLTPPHGGNDALHLTVGAVFSVAFRWRATTRPPLARDDVVGLCRLTHACRSTARAECWWALLWRCVRRRCLCRCLWILGWVGLKHRMRPYRGEERDRAPAATANHQMWFSINVVRHHRSWRAGHDVDMPTNVSNSSRARNHDDMTMDGCVGRGDGAWSLTTSSPRARRSASRSASWRRSTRASRRCAWLWTGWRSRAAPAT